MRPGAWNKRRSAIALALWLALGATANAAGPPGPLKDWPCPVPLEAELTAATIWPAASLPAALPEAEAWKANSESRQVVEFVADPENSPASGSSRIAELAASRGGFHPELSMLVLSGIIERINGIRSILIEGIRTHVIRSHILAEAVAENNKALALATTQPSTDPASQPDAIKKARFFNLRALDDAGDGAEMLCHRYSYDEIKAKALAAALQQHTQ
jgi:hypothetical protein